MRSHVGGKLLAAVCLAAVCSPGSLGAVDKKPLAVDMKPLAVDKKPLAVDKKPAAVAKPATPRPAWIDAQPGLIDEGYQKVIVVGPYSTEPECHREIPARLVEAVDEYALAYDPTLGPYLHINGEALQAEQPRLVREQFSETISSSVGPMRQIHLRLVFDRKFNRWLDQRLAQVVVGRRVGLLAVAGACVLAMLAVAWLVARRTGGLAKEA
jgi:hypothetical protein